MKEFFGTSVQEYYLELARKNSSARKVRLDALKNPLDAKAYAASVRAKIHALFELPTEKTPLNAKVTGTIGLENGVVLEKLYYFSRPGYPVTANLFRPEKISGKCPCVLFVCGHANDGKCEAAYQTAAAVLAEKGFLVLSVDPVGQGERHQFPEFPDFESNCCLEHNTLAKQMLLNGDWFGTWRVWDAIRGLDYLLSRPEADSSRVGVTGNSGGGTMTSFLNALDDRFTMAAPSCYMGSWLANIENELPADAEQIIPGALAAGLEMSDLILAAAPRPVLLLGQKNDFFDPRALMDAYGDIRRVYSLLGAEDSVDVFIGPSDHGYGPENRARMYGFFTRTAFGKADSEEPAGIRILSEAECAAAPGGRVTNLPENRLLRELIAEKTDGFARTRSQNRSLGEMRRILRESLALTEDVSVPHYRKLRQTYGNGNVVFNRFGLETEPGRVMSVLKLVSKNRMFFHIPALAEATLYIPELDSQDELSGEGTADGVFGLDVRGIGECMPSGCDQWGGREFYHLYSYDYHYQSLGLFFSKPYSGGKVKDILCAVKLLKASGVGKVHLRAKGQGAVPALFAWVLSDDFESYSETDAPESYEAMIRSVTVKWPVSCMIPGILRETDLPAIRAVKPFGASCFREKGGTWKVKGSPEDL